MHRIVLGVLLLVLASACHSAGTMPVASNDVTLSSLPNQTIAASRWHIAYSHGYTYAGVVVGPDGNIWMCDGGLGTTLDRFTAHGVRKYELGYYPQQLAVGADRAFWITANPRAILRVTTDGKITAYPVRDLPVGGIILGPDHNIWFVEQHYIGRLTPRGQLNEYPLIIGSEHVEVLGSSGIAWGPDNHLWFGAGGSGRYLVNLDPTTGKIRIAGPGSPSMGPVVAGPDGNIWYIDTLVVSSYRTILTKITPSGDVTTYEGPPNFVQALTPQGMIVGSDHELWFVTQHIGGNPPHVIGGGLVRYDIQTNRFTVNQAPNGYEWEWGLAFDSDGSIWMSANNQAQVFTPAAP